MERKFLEEMGLEKEMIDKILNQHSSEIGKHKQSMDQLTAERDKLQEQLTQVQEKLQGFESINVDELKGQITQLQADIKAKDSEYQQQLSDQAFEALVAQELTAARGKNSKAIAALLDMEALKGSKNQKADVAAAVEVLKKSDGYLFEADKKGGTFKGLVPGQGSVDPTNDESDYQSRYDNAMKTGNRTEAIAIKQEAADEGVFL